jgi:hypothetical protein
MRDFRSGGEDRVENPDRSNNLNDFVLMAGWPTPTANTFSEDLDKGMARRAQLNEKHGNGNGAGITIALAAQMAGWPTPMAGTPAQKGYNEAGNNDSSRKTVALVGWPTPTAQDGSRGNGTIRPQDTGIPLPQRAAMAGWPTPTTRDYKDTGDLEGSMYRQDGQLRDDTVPRVAWMAGPARLTATGEMLTGSSAGMESGGQLNPRFSGWLMGYSTAWCEAALSSQQPTRSRKGKSAE